MSIYTIGETDKFLVTYDVRDILEEALLYVRHAETILQDKRTHSVSTLRDARGYAGRAEVLVLMLPLTPLADGLEEHRQYVRQRVVNLTNRLNAGRPTDGARMDIPLI